MRRPPSVLVSAATLLASAAACRSSTAPAPGAEAGRYVAIAVAGRAFPARTDSSAQEFGVALADTLELDGGGGGRRAFAVRRARPALGTDTVYRVAVAVAYRRSGARLVVGQATPCPPNALCIADDTGRVSRLGLTLASFWYAGGAPVAFVRVGPPPGSR